MTTTDEVDLGSEVAEVRCAIEGWTVERIKQGLAWRDPYERRTQRQRTNILSPPRCTCRIVSVLNMAVELGWLLRVPRIRKPKIQIFSQDYR